MKRLALEIACLLVAGCGGMFAEAAKPALGQALGETLIALGEVVKQRTGNELSSYPFTCEHEYHPDTLKALFLCEVDLSRQVSR